MANAVVDAIDINELPELFQKLKTERNLSEPVLPIPSLIVDGIEWSGNLLSDKPFPTARENPEERAEYMGKFWAHNGMLEYINTKGEYVVTLDKQNVHAALKAANYERANNFGYSQDTKGTIFCNGSQPAPGRKEREFKRMRQELFNATPELCKATLGVDLESVSLRLEAYKASLPPKRRYEWEEEPVVPPLDKSILQGAEHKDPSNTFATKAQRVIMGRLNDAIKTGKVEEVEKVLNGVTNAWEASCKLTNSKNVKELQGLLEPLSDNKRFNKFLENTAPISYRNVGNVSDMTNEFANHVVLPQLLLEYSKQTGKPLDQATLDHLGAQGLPEKIYGPVREHLLAGRSLDKVEGLSQAWHSAQVAFPDALKPLGIKGEWASLTTKNRHDVTPLPGVYIQELTTSNELESEGNAMNHCVGKGAYASRCQEGKCNIFSVRREGQDMPISTIEAVWEHGQLKIIQNYGVSNSPPESDAKIAAEWFKAQLEGRDKNRDKGESIELNPDRKIDDGKSFVALKHKIGFEITQENVQAAFEEYCNNSLRRAREYNPETKKFDIISRRTELIAGSIDLPVQSYAVDPKPESFIILDQNGNQKKSSVNAKLLQAEQWFESSGIKGPVMEATLNGEIAEIKLSQQREREAQQQREAELKAKKLEEYRHSTPFDGRLCHDTLSKVDKIRDALYSVTGDVMPKSLSQHAGLKPKRGGIEF